MIYSHRGTITAHSRQCVDYEHPEGRPISHPDGYAPPFLVYAEDVKTALSRQCRYAGAVDVSVLAHSALCVLLADTMVDHALVTPSTSKDGMLRKRLRAYAAAHDLHEAYVTDVPSPLKRLLPAYKVIEERWERYVHARAGLVWPGPVLVHDIDRRAVVVETAILEHPDADHFAHWCAESTEGSLPGTGRPLLDAEREAGKLALLRWTPAEQWACVEGAIRDYGGHRPFRSVKDRVVTQETA